MADGLLPSLEVIYPGWSGTGREPIPQCMHPMTTAPQIHSTTIHPSLEHYLPLSGAGISSWFDLDHRNTIARTALHRALRPLLEQPCQSPACVLAEARATIAQIEAAWPAWSDALEQFACAAEPAPHAEQDELPDSGCAPRTLQRADFFARYAPLRSGVWAAADRVIWDALQDLTARCTMPDLRLRDHLSTQLPIEIRAYRLGLAKFEFDLAVSVCPPPALRRREELRLAQQVQDIFGLTGLIREWDRNGSLPLHALRYDTRIFHQGTPEQVMKMLWHSLRVPLCVWAYMDDQYGVWSADSRHGAWLSARAGLIETFLRRPDLVPRS